MRYSRVLHISRVRPRDPYPSFRIPQKRIGQGYCSSCDAPIPIEKATATSKPLSKPPADHRTIGVQQELFTTSKYSPGSAIFLPNGTKIFNRLTNFLRNQYEHYGFEEVISPTIYKKSLWEKSGHWENYAEDMYSVTGRGAQGTKEDQQVGKDEVYGLKPMNCPGHCLIFASQKRSYRDLPLRFADFSPLHRNEITGALSGLTRGRRFHQDDGHIFCRPVQIREEISKTLEFVRQTYGVLNLGTYRLCLSTRPKDHFIGTTEEWDNAEAALRESLDESGQHWTINEGDGAFYGPKIDVILKDSDGKEHQTATIQLDFQLPKRFELEYQAPAPDMEQRGLATNDAGLLAVEGAVAPVMIHRAVLGSVERIMALLIERYNGYWPFWLNPKQIIILTLNDSQEVVEYAQKVKHTLQMVERRGVSSGFRRSILTPVNGLTVKIDPRPLPLKKKVNAAKLEKPGIIIVIGKKNMDNRNINVDFTGLPRNRYDIASHPQLQAWIKRQSGREATKSHSPVEHGNGEELERIEPAPPLSPAKGVSEAAGQTNSPPRLTEQQLKNITVSPASLRVLLEDLRDAYV